MKWRFNLPDNVSTAANINGDDLPPIFPNVQSASLIDTLLGNDVFVVAGGLTPLPPPAPQTVSYCYAEALWDAAILFARFSTWTETPDLPSSPTWGSVTWGSGYPLSLHFGYPPGHAKADFGAAFSGPNDRYDPSPTGENNPMGIPWSNMSAVFAGYMYHLPYNLAAQGGGPLALTGLVHSTTNLTAGISIPPGWNGGSPPAAPTSGPTGDGKNEFCWARGQLPNFGVGLVSMLVNPTTGAIAECDIIMPTSIAQTGAGAWGAGNVASTPNNNPPVTTTWYAGPPSPAVPNPPTVGTPSSWSILAHEVGHFFGLDHTNIFPPTAALGVLPSPVNVLGGFVLPGGIPTTLMSHARWEDIPLMAPTMFQTGPFLPGNSGDIYISHYDPVNNSGQRVQGKTDRHSMGYLHPDDVTGMCRLYPQTDVAAGSPRRPMINDLARIEGAILSPTLDDGGVFGRNVLVFDLTEPPFDLAPNNGAISGTHRLGPDHIVGAADISTPAVPKRNTGGFIVPYVKAGPNDPLQPIGAGIDHLIAVEPLASLLVQPNNPATTPFGEWWADPVLGTQATNAITPFTLSTSTVVSSYRLFAATSKGSLFTVPGTVIQLSILESGLTLPEAVSRPVVALHPRTGYTGPSQVITATVFSDFPIQQAAFIVNGVVKPVSLGDSDPQPYAGPYQISFSATAGDLGVTSGSLVTAMALEFTWQAGWTLPTGAGSLPSAHVPGANECRF